MYLYFQRNTGILKEMINDEALRAGNDGVNKMYIYLEGMDTDDNIESCWVRFICPDGTVIPDTSAEQINPTDIPYNAKRDLRFFKYYKKYPFFVISIPMSDISGHISENSNTVRAEIRIIEDDGNGILSTINDGVLTHPLDLPSVDADEVLQLGDVLFTIDTYNQTVEPTEYLSLAQYNYLVKLISERVDTYSKAEIDALIQGVESEIPDTSDFVDMTTDQTINGVKTFNDAPVLADGEIKALNATYAFKSQSDTFGNIDLNNKISIREEIETEDTNMSVISDFISIAGIGEHRIYFTDLNNKTIHAIMSFYSKAVTGGYKTYIRMQEVDNDEEYVLWESEGESNPYDLSDYDELTFARIWNSGMGYQTLPVDSGSVELIKILDYATESEINDIFTGGN